MVANFFVFFAFFLWFDAPKLVPRLPVSRGFSLAWGWLPWIPSIRFFTREKKKKNMSHKNACRISMGHTDGWSRVFSPHPTVAPPFSRGITSPRHWGWHFHKARRPLGSNVDLYNYDSHSIWDFLGKIHEIPRGFFMVFAHQCGQMKCDIFKLMFLKNKKHISSHPIFYTPLISRWFSAVV